MGYLSHTSLTRPRRRTAPLRWRLRLVSPAKENRPPSLAPQACVTREGEPPPFAGASGLCHPRRRTAPLRWRLRLVSPAKENRPPSLAPQACVTREGEPPPFAGASGLC